MTPLTADLSDAHPDAEVAQPLFRDFGGLSAFHGPIATVKVFEDNALVKSTLETPGGGRVLVIDGGGSLRCALIGGNLAELAFANGWRGLLIYGCIRDAAEIRAVGIGVKALASNPRRPEKGLHLGQRARAVTFAGVTFREDEWLYADVDGIVVGRTALHAGA